MSTTEQKALELAEAYAQANATFHLESLYGTSKTYTAEKQREALEAQDELFAELRRLSAENEALRAQVEALTGGWEALRHAGNEWADMATNGLQWARNIKEGISTGDDAVESLTSDLAHCQATQAKASLHPPTHTPSPLTRPAVPEGWKPSHQELYAMSKDAGQLTVMPPLEWLICFSARVLAAAPQPPGEVAGPAVTAELAGHFREALAWGKVYGARMELELWDEMRERMVLEFTRRAAAPQPEAQPEPVSIELDFKQATELLEMFGGEPGLVTLIPGDGHSGQGLYACWTDVPGEGAIYLGNSDDEARPEAQPEAQPADPHANCPPPVDEIEAAEREHLGCAHCKTGIYAKAQPTEAAQKGGA